MKFEDFLDLTPKEFFEALWEREEFEEKRIVAHIRPICETIRMQTLHLMNIQLPKGEKIYNLKRLMKFKWEKEEETRPAQTFESMRSIMKAIANKT